MRHRLGMIFSIPPTLATLLVAAMIAAGTWYGARAMRHTGAEPLTLDDSMSAPEAFRRALPEVRMQDVDLADAIAFCARTTGITIHLTPAARAWVRANGQPVSARFRNVKASKALRTIVALASDGYLVVDTDENDVTIMTPAERTPPLQSRAGVP